jgi:DNA-binding response OmpR family regulator
MSPVTSNEPETYEMANLLVVDDDRDVAAPLITFLEILGHTVRYAADGYAGLDALRVGFPDMILLDVDMPRLSGPGMVLRMFAEDAGRENIPILVVSGVADIDAVAEMIGTPYFIAKPFHLEQLEQLTNLVLREKRAPRPREAA